MSLHLGLHSVRKYASDQFLADIFKIIRPIYTTHEYMYIKLKGKKRNGEDRFDATAENSTKTAPKYTDSINFNVNVFSV